MDGAHKRLQCISMRREFGFQSRSTGRQQVVDISGKGRMDQGLQFHHVAMSSLVAGGCE